MWYISIRPHKATTIAIPRVVRDCYSTKAGPAKQNFGISIQWETHNKHPNLTQTQTAYFISVETQAQIISYDLVDIVLDTALCYCRLYCIDIMSFSLDIYAKLRLHKPLHSIHLSIEREK